MMTNLTYAESDDALRRLAAAHRSARRFVLTDAPAPPAPRAARGRPPHLILGKRYRRARSQRIARTPTDAGRDSPSTRGKCDFASEPEDEQMTMAQCRTGQFPIPPVPPVPPRDPRETRGTRASGSERSPRAGSNPPSRSRGASRSRERRRCCSSTSPATFRSRRAAAIRSRCRR